jgi:mRNA interferase RelE/StbE
MGLDIKLILIANWNKNPRPQGSRKITGSKNDWRIRVGDYRIIYEIDAHAEIIRVMRIRHRKDVYR